MKEEKQIETGTRKPCSVVRAHTGTKNELRARIKCSIQDIQILLLFCVVLLLISGCGKKFVPRAPELVLPEAIRDLRVRPGKNWIVLSWSRPKLYLDGKKLRDLGGFMIFRKDVSASCPDCPTPYRQMTIIDVEDQEKFIQKQVFRFKDGELTAQTIYHYRVFSRLQDGALSEPSNDAQLSWRP